MFPEGNAIVYCEGAFGTPNGKTAHGLIRRTLRYRILSVVDSRCAGKDAGFLLDGKEKGIPVFADLQSALKAKYNDSLKPTHLVIGLAPDGGRLSPEARQDVIKAIKMGLNVDSGLHDFLSEDQEMVKLAKESGLKLRDVRKPPDRKDLHFFSGKIEQVDSFKIAMLGTDSAVGKGTTAWILVDALKNADFTAEMIGTGQTAWMQGTEYGIILDSLINDFVAGEIEHAVWSAWHEKHPDVIIIEGQGSLMNPAYPGGFEIMAAGKPDVIVVQHAPARKTYDGFPDYPMHPIQKQIEAIELLSGKPVVLITVNHENISKKELPGICKTITEKVGLPAIDPLLDDPQKMVDVLKPYLTKKRK
jgi:uncharacterized NAD-dependent epimerase/dehydratase family protein